MNFGKKSCIKRARKLIEEGTPESLRYACLEMRYCIEAICYEKASLYKNQLSESEIKTWQPKKLIEILLEFDPNVNDSHNLRMWSENEDGSKDQLVFSGHHKALPTSILRKHYNKLGSYLHTPTISKKNKTSTQQKSEELKKYLELIILPIEESTKSTCISNFAVTVSTHCQKCGELLIRNCEKVKKDPLVVCPNINCRAEYDVAINNDGSTWQLRQLNLICPDCSSINYFDRHLLENGATIECFECNQKFVFSQVWNFSKIEKAET